MDRFQRWGDPGTSHGVPAGLGWCWAELQESGESDLLAVAPGLGRGTMPPGPVSEAVAVGLASQRCVGPSVLPGAMVLHVGLAPCPAPALLGEER